MEIKDLRIGNLLYYNNEEKEIASINLDSTIRFKDKEKGCIGCFKIYLDLIKPIPITEEWLLKFGFKYNNPTYEWYDKSAVFFIQVNYLGFDLIAKFHNQVIREIKYVHELQNLYFALTEKELAKV